MPFPDFKREIFPTSLLDKVVCQLNFPPILKIESKTPVEFQDEIRSFFSSYSKKMNEMEFLVPRDIQNMIPVQILGQITQAPSGVNYQFGSEDDAWQVKLSRELISLTTTDYGNWDHFKDKLELPLKALKTHYEPISFSRLRLKYINIVRRSKLGIKENVPWKDLIQPYITGVFGTDCISDNEIRQFDNKYEIVLPGGSDWVYLSTRFVKHKENNEVCFVIDTDFIHRGKIPVGSEMEICEKFHQLGYRIIRWCITDTLLDIMRKQKSD